MCKVLTSYRTGYWCACVLTWQFKHIIPVYYCTCIITIWFIFHVGTCICQSSIQFYIWGQYIYTVPHVVLSLIFNLVHWFSPAYCIGHIHSIITFTLIRQISLICVYMYIYLLCSPHRPVSLVIVLSVEMFTTLILIKPVYIVPNNW